MHSRRKFVQGGLAASALATCPLTARIALADARLVESHQIFKVIFDQTLAAGALFEVEAVGRGASALAIGDDAGSVWMNAIEPRWKLGPEHGPAAVAGLTGRASLFCLELLARDYGMGVVYRAEHAPAADGSVLHVITAPGQLSEWESRLNAAGKHWGAVAAAMALSCPAALLADPGIDLLDPAQPSRVAGPSLFSWVIAPTKGSAILGGGLPITRG